MALLMARMRLRLILAGLAVVVCAVIFTLHTTKPQRLSDGAADTASAQAKHGPFRSAVVELTFLRRSVSNGMNTRMRHAHGLTDEPWQALDPLIPRPRKRCDKILTLSLREVSAKAK